MKKTNQYLLLSVCALGVLTLSPKLMAADCAMPSCCGSAKAEAVADTAAKAKAYPLDTCLVSGEKLGEMGKPFIFVHKDQEIKLCCKGCKKDFDKDPEKFLKKLAADKK